MGVKTMDTDLLATVYYLNEEQEQSFSDYDELMGFIAEHQSELEYIKWH